MALKIKKQDRVMVISGKDKGTEGRVVRVFPDRHMVVVEGVNKARKHQKPRKQGEAGGIVDKEMPIHVSNVMLIGKSGKPVRVARKALEGGKRVRVERKTGAVID